MKQLLILAISCVFITTISCQETTMESKDALPYYQIPDYPDSYLPGNVLSRMIDGLGYRYFWATKDLRPEDLAYRPSEDASSSDETLDHIFGLSITILNATTSTPNVRPRKLDPKTMTYEEKRAHTLRSLKKASENLLGATAEDVEKMKIIFQRNEQSSEFPFWNNINGPIADAIYHTGQIVSFRRTSGNPINPKVSVFSGKTRE